MIATAGASALGQAGGGIAARNSSSARFDDSPVGHLLPLELLPLMGSCLLLLSKQLFHRGVRRCGSPARLAALRTCEEHDRGVDVWNIGEYSLCSRQPLGRPRSCDTRANDSRLGGRIATIANVPARVTGRATDHDRQPSLKS